MEQLGTLGVSKYDGHGRRRVQPELLLPLLLQLDGCTMFEADLS